MRPGITRGCTGCSRGEGMRTNANPVICRHSGLAPESRRLSVRILDSGVRRNGLPRTRSGDEASPDLAVQIPPSRVGRLDQVQLPCTAPTLERFLTRNGRSHRLVRLVPDQRMNPIFLGESVHKIVLVLSDALHKIRRHADVERAVSLAGEDIDAGLLHGPSVLDSGVRRNDGANPVIPGKRSATRNPGAAPDIALDSGVRRNDGWGRLRRNHGRTYS